MTISRQFKPNVCVPNSLEKPLIYFDYPPFPSIFSDIFYANVCVLFYSNPYSFFVYLKQINESFA